MHEWSNSSWQYLIENEIVYSLTWFKKDRKIKARCFDTVCYICTNVAVYKEQIKTSTER